MPGQGLTAQQVATKGFLVFSDFETMDTHQSRVSLPKNRLAWCENLQIIGPNFLEVMPGPSAATTTIPGQTISLMYFANYGGNDYIIAFTQSGAGYQIALPGGAQTQFAPPGTFSATPDCTVWSSQRLLIADPVGGYATWDGSVGVVAGGLSPSLVVTFGGQGLTIVPTVTITDLAGFGSGATATATVVSQAVSKLTLTASGSGFKANSVPAVSFASAGQPASVGTNFVVLQGGSQYTSVPAVTVTGGGGSVQATGTAVVTNGIVTSITLNTPGSGYTSTPTVTIAAPGGVNGTQAYAQLQLSNVPFATARVWPIFTFPAGVSGPSTIAVFQGRVWLGAGRALIWTGVTGFDDSSLANASGQTTITDADLVHKITALRSLNNYLFIFGDNSIKQIGNVSVSGSLTLFNIITLSSDQGTIYPNSIQSYNRLILFANKVGVYAIFGASVEKISDEMDGIFQRIDFSQVPQAAINDINNIHCYLLLVRYMDPARGSTRSIMLMFMNRKWMVVSQGDSLVAIATAPLVGISETFASSGNDITQIVQNNAANVSILLITALSNNEHPHFNKRMIKAATLQQGVSAGQTMTVTFDTENGSPVTKTYSLGVGLIWINNALANVTWVNNLSQSVVWAGSGVQFQPIGGIAGTGIYLGMTLKGTFSQLSLNQMIIEYQEATAMASMTSA